MEQNLFLKMKKRLIQSKKQKRRQRIVTVLAGIVVFCTTYALILPAITMEGKTYCSKEAHVHDNSCYEKVLKCELTEEGHTHTDSCLQKDKILVCSIPEEGHMHTESCVNVTQTLICEQEEHMHTDACYTQSETCICEKEGHTHTDACYTQSETCVCEQEEHTHTAACYTQSETYICGQEERDVHKHSEECYEEIVTYICDQEEGQAHTHGEDCYEESLVCTKDEHEHELSCYSNPDADLEMASVWERTIPTELSGIWADDLLKVAESQLGYEESDENYIVTNQDTKKGYTRYGAWYGDAYGDWCAMFVSFCLHYAEIPEDMIVQEANCANWVEKLQKSQQYHTVGEYIPQKGDIIFFDMRSTVNGTDHVGIVAEVDEEQSIIKTIEGNSDNKVQYCTYEWNHPEILGYGKLPENPDMADSAADGDAEEAQTLMMSTFAARSAESQAEQITEVFADYLTGASASEVTVTDGEYYTNLTLQFKIPAESAAGKKFVYDIPDGMQFTVGLSGTTQTVTANGMTAYICEFIENTDGTQQIQIIFEDNYLESVSEEIVSSFTFSAELRPEFADESGKISLMLSGEVKLELQMLSDSDEQANLLPAGKYGNYYFDYNNTKNAFTTEEAYAPYYNENSPLGLAGSFHIVAFDTATLSAHTNGNVLAHTLRANSNFGTNNYSNELSYAVHYQKLNSTSASSNDHILVIGSENNVTLGGNNDNIYINEVKIDKPYHIIQDADTAKNPFINLNAVNIEVAGISSRLASSADGGITTSFSDQNNRSIQLDNPDSVGYYTITASALNDYANNPMRMQGFTKNGDGTMIINVDCTGVKTINMPTATIWIDGQEQSTAEVTEFSNGKVIWNFINATGATINTNRMTGMVIALGATVNIQQNLNGTVIAEFVNVQAESHRTDFTGEIAVLPDKEDGNVNIGIRKVNSENISIYLEGAEFSLLEWKGSEYETVNEKLATDANGLLSIDNLSFNTAYRLVETKAPSGYILDAEPYEFYVPNSDTSKYPYSKPQDFAGAAHGVSIIKNIRNDKDEEEKRKITLEKKWYIDGQEITSVNGLINVDIYQQVYGDAECTEKVMDDILYANAVEIDSHQGWTITLDNLPAKGSKTIGDVQKTVYYKYYAVEEPIPGYTPTYDNNDGITQGTITITNTSDGKNAFTELTLEKAWFDFEGNAMDAPEHAEVTIHLYQTGYEGPLFHHQLTDKVLYQTVALSADNKWKQTITELPDYEVIETENGKRTVYYMYTADEVSIGGYADTYDNNNTNKGTILIKNTLKEHPTGIIVEKKWLDENYSEVSKEGEIYFDLYQKVYGFIDEETYDSADYKSTKLYKDNIMISSENGWKTSVTNLPQHGWMMIDGERVKVAYTYYIQERQTEGYKTTYENNQGITGKETDENGNVINKITIINKKLSEYSLPKTGGPGTELFALVGLVLIFISLCGYKMKNRKEVT